MTDPIAEALDVFVPAFVSVDRDWQGVLQAAGYPAALSPVQSSPARSSLLPPRLRLRLPASNRTKILGIAVAATAAALIGVFAVPRGTSLHHPVRAAGPGAPGAVSVSTVDEADAHLPFNAVLPSNPAPTGGIQVPIAGKPSDSSGGFTAHFDTDAGSYMLSEYTSDATVETLQHWAAMSAEQCSNCAQQVATQDGVHVLVLESPVFGLRLQWVRGDGTSPVMTELDWSRNMPTNNVIPSQDAALAIADDIISQGG